MSFFIIGSLVGLVLVLTGSGGAIIGIPLLIHLAHMPVKEASVMALPIVGVSALVSLIFVRRFVSAPAVFLIMGPAAVSSYGMSYLKPYFSSRFILFLLIMMAFLGLFQLFFSKDTSNSKEEPVSFLKAGLIGLISGALTTLTGLGGGIILFPLFKQFLHMSDRKASATSLMVIAISVGLSLFFQLSLKPTFGFELSQGIELFLGLILANILVYFFYKLVPEALKKRLVKGVYAVVLVLSIVMLVI